MAWVNKHLKERDMKVENLAKDFQNGVILINLLEAISGQQVKTYYREPNRLYQYLENLEVAVKFMNYLGLPIMAAPQGNLLFFGYSVRVLVFNTRRFLPRQIEHNRWFLVRSHSKVQGRQEGHQEGQKS